MKRIINIITFASVCYFVTGCKKDYLELKPYDQVALDIAVKTEGDMQAATNGIYTILRGATLYGRDEVLRADVLADNVYISTTNSNRFLEYTQVNYLINSATVTATWNNSYAAILRANNVINSSIAANAITNQYKGEALALRALLYMDLLKQFANPYDAATAATDLGVPLILSYDPTLKPTRNTIKEVYDQAEKDLTTAIGLLTERAPYSAGYMNKTAAKALLARKYQFTKDWARALSTAQDIITTSGYSLTTAANHVSYWGVGTPRTDRLESLFELGFDPNGNAGFESLPYFFLQAGYGDGLATDALYNLYSPTDVRRIMMVDGSRAGKNVKIINKYPSNINYTIKILRLSEVYLIAAEASFQTGKIAEALVYLNTIATRRDAAFAGYASTGTLLQEDILIERRKELAFEGHRYWDLTRYNRDVVRVNLNNNYPANNPLTIAVTNFRRILPIPQTELDANPNIKPQQNPGY